ncbi:glycogen debranching enzyme GlgX [Methylorubrum rhodesianum]|nr:glycogen debranching enzyme GlgX [Methylorubrum rhodesianum]
MLQLVTDSLRYWATEMRVDGFRFDLATILGREPYGFDEGGGFLDTCRQDPVLNDVKLIAEPWDCGPGGYQVGGFPPGWAEWNDRFRDDVRGYWKGDAGLLPGLASRITASADKFNKRGRKPWASVNFVTAHDGFTLNDTVSYNEKHNEANGEGNRDGHGHNLSYNYGVEGPTDDPEIRAVRLSTPTCPRAKWPPPFRPVPITTSPGARCWRWCCARMPARRPPPSSAPSPTLCKPLSARAPSASPSGRSTLRQREEVHPRLSVVR